MNTAQITVDRDKLLADWKESKALLDKIKITEAALRNQVIETFSSENDPMASGVENVDVGWGYKLKVTHKLTYKLDNANDCEALDKVLEAIENTTEGGSVIAARIIKWKPELSVSEYKLLNDANKARIDAVLTISPAAKSLELVEPKGS
jgi:hypothetical protein